MEHRSLRRIAVRGMFLLIASLCVAAAAKPHSVMRADGSAEELQALAREYRQLRELREHLPPGEFRPELSDDSGRMHRVMYRLSELLADRHMRASALIDLLGAPNEIYGAGRWHSDGTVARGEKYLAYWWRGGHDYLYFVLRKGIVVDVRWWFAYE